jgi:hypothetical protein
MMRKWTILLILCGLCSWGPAWAQEIGQIKTLSGAVHLERAGKSMPAAAGMKLLLADTLRTGRDGAVGVTFTDNAMISAGPESTLVLSRYAFDSTTHQGEFNANLRRGTLSMVSGKLAKQSSTAVRVTTPAAIIGVRGTEFFVKVEGQDHE